MTPPQLRLFLLHAPHAPLSVILRRGLSKLHRLILRRRTDDSFENGQWRCACVYAERCALSPGGRHVLAFLRDGALRAATTGICTVLRRPPCFTARSLYPAGDKGAGGGAVHGHTHDAVFRNHPTGDLSANATRLTRVYPTAKGYALRDHTHFTPPPAIPPIPVDHVTTDAGKLLRMGGDTPHPIRDLTAMTVAPLQVPSADQAGHRAPSHPRDSDTSPWP